MSFFLCVYFLITFILTKKSPKIAEKNALTWKSHWICSVKSNWMLRWSCVCFWVTSAGYFVEMSRASRSLCAENSLFDVAECCSTMTIYERGRCSMCRIDLYALYPNRVYIIIFLHFPANPMLLFTSFFYSRRRKKPCMIIFRSALNFSISYASKHI